MPSRPFLPFLLVLLLVMSGQHSPAAEIPFAFRDGLIWLKVSVTGRSAPLNFLLDSGASATVVDLAAARALGMKPRGAVEVAGVHSRCVGYEWDGFSATVGGLPLPRSVLALDLGHLSGGCHQRVDGLIGADFFSGRIVQIDYARSVARIFPRHAAPTLAGAVLPLAIRNDAMCVRVSAGRPEAEWTRVDTGCDGALHWVVPPGTRGREGRESIAATIASGRQVRLPVQIGPEPLGCVKTTLHARRIFPGEAGLVGNGVLSRFTVTFDRDGRRLLLARR